jgi:hypothetical protein
MSKSKQPESQQQAQGITIGTQGNDDQPTPQGDDINYSREAGNDGAAIPNQENSSATNKRKGSGDSASD